MTHSTSTQPAHTNRLIDATSPYLLQHAHNPVDWYPWGPEALEAAKKQDKPIFLSIGYSACHWCHVMERESFENEAIAAILNEHFVAIKVDREERPDLDEIYMNATMLYTGSGGWPMSVFLTPARKPFFAGTYFPPDSRYGRPGFSDVLHRIAELWRDDREKLLEGATRLTEAIEQIESPRVKPLGSPAVPDDLVSRAANGLARAFDPEKGGILSGQTNKFPPSMSMSLMLRAYDRTQQAGQPNTTLLERVTTTLDHMADGGIYDHLGGGIARYSTDPDWLVPHFEKMLYDQGLVSGIYVEAFQLTRNTRYADVARDIFAYVMADLQSPEGGFYSARDADSEGEEGKFYVWTRDEVTEVLGQESGALFCSYYDVTETGNWEGKNILHVERDLATVAKLNGVEPDRLREVLRASRETLLSVRSKRVPPALDDKVLTSWNALMIASLARGGRILDERKYIESAAKAAGFIIESMTRDGRLLRTYRAGKAHTPGYLDDYAFFVDALIELYEASFDRRWLDEAIRLNDDAIKHFWDDEHGGCFFTSDDAEELIVRSKDMRDGAIPSGNSVALMNLLRLALIQDRDDLREKAIRTIQAYAGKHQSEDMGPWALIERSPFSFERFLAAVDFAKSTPREVVITGSPADASTRALIAAVDQVYDPNRVMLVFDPSAKDAAGWQERIPLLQGKTLIDGKPAAFVCRNYTCKRPVTEVGDLLRELKAD